MDKVLILYFVHLVGIFTSISLLGNMSLGNYVPVLPRNKAMGKMVILYIPNFEKDFQLQETA